MHGRYTGKAQGERGCTGPAHSIGSVGVLILRRLWRAIWVIIVEQGNLYPL